MNMREGTKLLIKINNRSGNPKTALLVMIRVKILAKM